MVQVSVIDSITDRSLIPGAPCMPYPHRLTGGFKHLAQLHQVPYDIPKSHTGCLSTPVARTTVQLPVPAVGGGLRAD